MSIALFRVLSHKVPMGNEGQWGSTKNVIILVVTVTVTGCGSIASCVMTSDLYKESH